MSYDDATVELEEQIKQQAAVIEQMREASLFFIGWAERNAMWDKCDSSYYLAKKASALQPCPEVLYKIRADAVREAAKWVGFTPDCNCNLHMNDYAQRIEKGEA